MVDVAEAERVLAAQRRRVARDARVEAAVAASLDEAEGGVAERGRDVERAQRPALVLVHLEVGDGGAAALLEEPEAPLRVLHLEDHRADAVGVLAEVAPGAPPSPSGCEQTMRTSPASNAAECWCPSRSSEEVDAPVSAKSSRST